MRQDDDDENDHVVAFPGRGGKAKPAQPGCDRGRERRRSRCAGPGRDHGLGSVSTASPRLRPASRQRRRLSPPPCWLRRGRSSSARERRVPLRVGGPATIGARPLQYADVSTGRSVVPAPSRSWTNPPAFRRAVYFAGSRSNSGHQAGSPRCATGGGVLRSRSGGVGSSCREPAASSWIAGLGRRLTSCASSD